MFFGRYDSRVTITTTHAVRSSAVDAFITALVAFQAVALVVFIVAFCTETVPDSYLFRVFVDASDIIFPEIGCTQQTLCNKLTSA
jgi:hypothetical protein